MIYKQREERLDRIISVCETIGNRERTVGNIKNKSQLIYKVSQFLITET